MLGRFDKSGARAAGVTNRLLEVADIVKLAEAEEAKTTEKRGHYTKPNNTYAFDEPGGALAHAVDGRRKAPERAAARRPQAKRKAAANDAVIEEADAD